MKNSIRLFFVIFYLGFLGCGKDKIGRCFKGTGSRTTETRTVAPFSTFYVEDNIDVILTQGPVQEIKIEAGENLVPFIRTNVVNGELQIKNENRCDWARSYKKGNITIRITNPVYKGFRNFSVGLISSSDTLQSDTFNIYTRETGDIDVTINTQIVYIQNLGASDITVKGKTGLMGIFHIGEGYLYCQNLRANIIWTTSEASGNEYFFPQSTLYATIKWVGDIYYSSANSPKVFFENQGTGKLIQTN